MEKQKIFEQTLTGAYEPQRYLDFIKEMITGVKIIAPTKEVKPYNTFSFYVSQYFHVGEFTDPEKNIVGIFAVELNKDESVERARTTQRSFVKSLLQQGNYSAALVAFYSKGDYEKWRFSFIRMDYEFSKGKITENLTPAKRYSYLVGKGEPCHTAMSRLYPIFKDDDKLPTIDEIEEAFSVETVTKQFFEAYKAKYIEMYEYLESNEDFVRESKLKNFTTEQFTKKLLSQIVFLYFIQKKGWLGVGAVPKTLTEKEYKNAFFSHGSKSRELVGKVYYLNGDVYKRNDNALRNLSDEDENELSKCVKGQLWGTGSKDFMRTIFNDCKNRGLNFFDDYLEPLFYTGLNQDRSEYNDFFPPLHCRIPFLNGGLFEELEHYDWKYNDFGIPNEMFSNEDTEKRDADGILDIFDRYNFTMAEDEPLEKEVAVDPEMLGKVFENLLEVKDRKSKGAFYTPREIVHYMCQESLINYLVTKSDIPEDDIRKFITLGEYFRDEDRHKTIRNSNTGKYEYDYNKKLEMPSSILNYKDGTNKIAELDKLLSIVKVADPAVGSGAFPLGLLNEIVKARETLTSYMSIGMNYYQKKNLYKQRSPYLLKKETIKNCIFACDIEPSAADITKLRLWLALVIDDNIEEVEDEEHDLFDRHPRPRKLPNLDCNVLCGNSLLSSFEGVKLICNTEALGNGISGTNVSIADKAIEGHINSLIDLQNSLYAAGNAAEKEELKKNIQVLYDAIIVEQLQQRPDLVRKYASAEVRNANSKPFVLWQLYFPKVFKENGGFDIVIGNPPYVQLQKSINDRGTKLGDLYQKEGFETFVKTGDLYCLFYEKGLNLLRKDGVLSFITSNKWMRAAYGENLRNMFVNKTNPITIIDFSSNKIFETATVDVNILILSKSENLRHTICCVVNNDYKNSPGLYIDTHGVITEFNSKDGWIILTPIETAIKQKVEKLGTPLFDWGIEIYRGILTGLNEAFIVDEETKNQLIKKDPNAINIIHPILRGKDMGRYEYNYCNKWLINTHNGESRFNISPVDINNYPSIKEHLDKYYAKLERRGDKGVTPYNLRNCAYLNEFDKEKIMYNDISQCLSFSLAPKGLYCNNTVYFISNNIHNKYLMASLNSKLFDWYYRTLSVQFGKGGVRLFSIYVKRIPIIICDKEIETHINSLVDSIMGSKDENKKKDYSDKIDEIIYKLYGLNNDEIEIIEEAYSNKKS